MYLDSSMGDDEGQGSLAGCSPWGRKRSAKSEWLNNSNGWNGIFHALLLIYYFILRFLKFELQRHQDTNSCLLRSWLGDLKAGYFRVSLFLLGNSWSQGVGRRLMDAVNKDPSSCVTSGKVLHFLVPVPYLWNRPFVATNCSRGDWDYVGKAPTTVPAHLAAQECPI